MSDFLWVRGPCGGWRGGDETRVVEERIRDGMDGEERIRDGG